MRFQQEVMREQVGVQVDDDDDKIQRLGHIV